MRVWGSFTKNALYKFTVIVIISLTLSQALLPVSGDLQHPPRARCVGELGDDDRSIDSEYAFKRHAV